MLSLVIPAYNEGSMVQIAYETIAGIMEQEKIPCEFVFVDDGSSDDTFACIRQLHEVHTNVHGLKFSRNFGKESAIMAGLKAAEGECAVVMDCDLQHPPQTVVEMYHLWQQGYEIVEGKKSTRKGQKESTIKRGFTRLFYKIMGISVGDNMADSSDFKLLDRKIMDIITQLPEQNTFFRALSFWCGFNTVSVPFEVQERVQGKTKWSGVKLMTYAVNNITSFTAAPLQLITGVGFFFLFASIILGIQTLVKYFSGKAAEGFTTVILLLAFIGAVIMIGLGIIGIYIQKIYDEIKRRPKFLIAEKI